MDITADCHEGDDAASSPLVLEITSYRDDEMGWQGLDEVREEGGLESFGQRELELRREGGGGAFERERVRR